MSLWIDLYPTISNDVRFKNMLGQPGQLTLSAFINIVIDLGFRVRVREFIVSVLPTTMHVNVLNTALLA